MKYTTERPAQQ